MRENKIKKIISFVLMILLIFSKIPYTGGSVYASATEITNGEYTISSNGEYQLANGYSGTITIHKNANKVTIIGDEDGIKNIETYIVVDSRPIALELTIKDIDISTRRKNGYDGYKSGIDFGSAGEHEHKLYINGTCKIESKKYPGIRVPSGVKLRIDEVSNNAKLEVEVLGANSNNGAGIGGGIGESGGNITIDGGIIDVECPDGAGIGGGHDGSGGNITINGGRINARSSHGAGIGGGVGESGGNIIINGGIINASSSYGAGIGGGDGSAGGNITINGGTVTATSGSDNGQGAGIGGGYKGSGGNITINGGTVTATGGGESGTETATDGAGIGGGFKGSGGNIIISGGTVTATGGAEQAAGIGGGYNGAGGDITISGGTVTATAGRLGAGIGGGTHGAGGSITIKNNPTVIATGGSDATDVGNGGLAGNKITTLTDESGRDMYYFRTEIEDSKTNQKIQNVSVVINDNIYTANSEGLTGYFVYGVHNYEISADKYSTSSGTEYGNGTIKQSNRKTYKLEPIYTITYDGNGSTDGTVPTDSNEYEEGVQVTVLGNTGKLTKSDYTFAGWNTAADGSGTNYAEKNKFEMGAKDITLYANWTNETTYSVTYNGNGESSGDVPTDSNNYLESSSAIVLGAGTITKNNHTFAGWNTAADGNGTTYSKDESLTIGTENVTLYAVWKIDTKYTIKYDGNGNDGGSVPEDNKNYFEGDTVTVKGVNTLTKTGHTFDGWTRSSHGFGTKYNEGDTLKMGTQDITLYAKWINPNVSLKWIKVGNDGFSANVSDISLKVDNGTPYVAYCDYGNSNGKVTVMKYNGSSWQNVGNPGFSQNTVSYLSMCIDNGTPYVAYRDRGNGYKATVMKYNGSSWQNVGAAGFSNGATLANSLYVYEGTPYVAYRDETNSNKLTVMKYDGVSWEMVGSETFLTGAAKTSMAVDDKGVLYVVAAGTVRKYNGSSWETVGNAAISDATRTSSLYIDNETPYVAYFDFRGDDKRKANVKKYNGTNWVNVGEPCFSPTISDISIQINNGTPYVSYKYKGTTGYLSVMKYNGATWEYVGSPRVSGGKVYGQSLDIDNDELYVAYRDANGKGNVSKYSNVYSVSFNSQGGSAVNNMTDVIEGHKITAPTAPTKEGYTFAGWYKESTCTTAWKFDSDIVTENITLYAKWIPLVDAETPEITNNLTDKTGKVNDVISLDATATVSDGGTISYKWYRVDNKSKDNKQLIASATTATYAVDTSSAGESYYYCEVTNTNNNVTGNKTAKTDSNVSQVTITTAPPLVDAETPVITNNLTDKAGQAGDSITLNATATVGDGGTISYKWYRVDNKSKDNKQLIASATTATYAVDTSSAGESYYYCEVTNTNNNVTGNKTAKTDSNVSQVTITTAPPLVDAETPVITNNLTDKAGKVNDVISLDATATVSDGGTISYKWYRVDNKSKDNKQLIASATTATYTVDTSSAGESYYYCEVTNTNNNVTGNKTAKTDSNVSQVTITTAPPLVDAETPVITNNLTDKAGQAGDSITLNATATVGDGGTISYKWYRVDNKSKDNKQLIASATTATYAVDTSSAGESYYYCEVTNTNNSVTGNKTAKTDSNVSQVTITTAPPLVDAETPVITNNLTDKAGQAGDSITLNATATVGDGGTISYKWYRVDNKSKDNKQLIASATTATYTVDTSSAGESYYYCEVTNTNNSVTGNKTAKTDSNVSQVTITTAPPLVDAETPVITNNLTDKAGQAGDSITLNATATVGDGGTISYKWYRVDNKSKDNKQLIASATTATYTVDTSSAGESYYYCEVTNTNNNVTGNKTAKTDSNVSQVTITTAPPLVDAETPVITNNLTDKAGQAGDSITLNATATVGDGGTISYKWYRVDNKSKDNKQLIASATTATYTVDTSSAGESYYYCEVTNTNNNVTGNKTAKTDSNVSQVTITTAPPLVDAETPVITNNLTDKAGQAGDSITLNATATVGDGGTISYKWYRVDNKSKDNKQLIASATTATYTVDTSSAGESYYYCEVTNTNNSVTGNKTAKTDSNVSQVTITTAPPLVDAETPVITNNLTDKAGQAGDSITLNATATVGDGGTISYKWYRVDNKSKDNKQLIASATTATYAVDTSSAGESYYYCEVTNTNNNVTGNKTAKTDSNVSQVTITTDPSSTKSIASYNPVTLTQTGDVTHNNVQYQTSSAVIGVLPSDITVTLEDGSTASVPVSWTDTDGYNAKSAGYYTFTATWGTLPNGVDNDDSISAPTCELKVAKGSTGGGSSSGGSTSKSKTPTEKANDEIKKAKPNAQGIIRVSVEVKTTSKGKTTFDLPSNFLENKAPVELTIENKDLQVILSNDMFTKNEKRVELIIEPTKKEKLGLSEEEQKAIGDNPVYNIYLKINGQKVDWEGSEDIAITINLSDKKNKEDHKFVAVYYDRKGNIQILKSSYCQNGKLYFTTKHLSDYGVMYVEPTFKDIENHWAKEAIEALVARGIIKGVSKEEFRPEEAISRADLVTLMVRYFGFTSDSEKVFNDVDSNKYYAKEIAIAKEIGLVKGFGNNMFKPLEPVSRQDMMVLLQRVIEISGEYPNIKPIEKSYLNFSDSSEISPYALKCVELMINSEIVKTRLTGICPKEKATRAEVVHALYNIMKTNMK